MTRAAPPILLALVLACGASEPRPAVATDPPATLARIAELTDNDERRALVASLRRVPAGQLHPLLVAGFASPAGSNRTAAALVAGRRADGVTFTAQLLAASADPEPSVRVAAARALGALRLPDAFPALQKNLSHETAAVRISALRALARIDPVRAAALPELPRLQLDPDPNVSDSATKVARQALK